MYMKDTEAAKYIGLSVHTLRDYRRKKQGGPKFYKIGRAVRYAVKDLERWAEDGGNKKE